MISMTRPGDAGRGGGHHGRAAAGLESQQLCTSPGQEVTREGLSMSGDMTRGDIQLLEILIGMIVELAVENYISTIYLSIHLSQE